jgi:hypothetical protein
MDWSDPIYARKTSTYPRNDRSTVIDGSHTGKIQAAGFDSIFICFRATAGLGPARLVVIASLADVSSAPGR